MPIQTPQQSLPYIVQKFGGTSVADAEAMRRCAKRVVDRHQAGQRCVVVVSAMGKTTDNLLALAHRVNSSPSRRELDMLLATGEQMSIALMTLAIHAFGADAISMTGQQLGIGTDEIHTRARIRTIGTERLCTALDQRQIVVAAGFQGVSYAGEITTLGRGGSDTTAVAIAAAIQRDAQLPCECEIYTDVEGVFTADPRIVNNARLIDQIMYDEMIELAAVGAGVVSSRAIAFGQMYDVPIRVRHSQKDSTGTLIRKASIDMEDRPVTGCALRKNLGRVSLRGLPNHIGVQAIVFDHIGRTNVVVDDIVQTEVDDMVNLSFTLDQIDLPDIQAAASAALDDINAKFCNGTSFQQHASSVEIEIGLAKVSAVGAGMQSQPGVASRMFQALAEADIPIHNITTSEIKICCILPMAAAERALQAIHAAFKLDA